MPGMPSRVISCVLTLALGTALAGATSPAAAASPVQQQFTVTASDGVELRATVTGTDSIEPRPTLDDFNRTFAELASQATSGPTSLH